MSEGSEGGRVVGREGGAAGTPPPTTATEHDAAASDRGGRTTNLGYSGGAVGARSVRLRRGEALH